MGKGNLIWWQLLLIAVSFIHRGKGCTLDKDCSSASICVKQICFSACAIADCGPNSQCKGVNHVAKCTCEPGYHLTEQGCQPSTGPVALRAVGPSPWDQPGGGTCRYHSDCGAGQRCVANSCTDVCPGACGPNLECTVKEHVPYCHCPRGYSLLDIGTPRCYSDAQGHGSTALGYGSTQYGRGCLTDNDCESDRSCRNQRCVSPCEDKTCSRGSTCYSHHHCAVCVPTRPADGQNYGVKEFYLSDFNINWYAAYHICWEKGMRLATVNNQAELDKVKGMIEGDETSVWLMGYKLDGKNAYAWTDSGLPIFTSEAYGYWDGYRDCYSIFPKKDYNRVLGGNWCFTDRRFACEYYHD